MNIYDVRGSDPLSIGLQFSNAILSYPESQNFGKTEREILLEYDANQIAIALGFIALPYRLIFEEGYLLPENLNVEPNHAAFGGIIADSTLDAYFSRYEILKIGLPGEEYYVRDLCFALRPAKIIGGKDYGHFSGELPEDYITRVPTSKVNDIIPL